MSRQRKWMLMLSTILWETVERLYSQFITFEIYPHFFCYCQDVMHLLDWREHEVSTKKIVSLLFGRAQNGYTPHIHLSVCITYLCMSCRRNVACSGLRRSDCFCPEKRLIQTSCLDSYMLDFVYMVCIRIDEHGYTIFCKNILSFSPLECHKVEISHLVKGVYFHQAAQQRRCLNFVNR